MSQFRSILDQHGPSLACWMFVAAVFAGAAVDRDPALAIYLVSFLYYGLYWRALAWGIRSFRVFKRDAILLKTLSVAALAILYLRAPPDPLSFAVIGIGIFLNVRAAAALGIDRTYYGRELAGLASRRVTTFPYSLMSHPMIVGNVLAFGGTLINADFRAAWWPLAALHVVLNLALLAMELVGPNHQVALRLAGVCVLSVTAAAATMIGLGSGPVPQAPHAFLAALLVAAIVGGIALTARRRSPAVPPIHAGNDNPSTHLGRETS